MKDIEEEVRFNGHEKKIFFISAFTLLLNLRNATYIFIPMDESQTQCLKAYGVAYMALKEGVTVEWLLNYRAEVLFFPMPHFLKMPAK